MAEWYREHRRAANVAVVATAVVLFGVAGGLGWALLQRTDVAVGGPSSSAVPTEAPEATHSAPTSSASATAQPTASASMQPATPEPTPEATPEASAAEGTIGDLFGADPPTNFRSGITCHGAIGASDPVAIVWLQQDDPVAMNSPVLRNYADVNAPRTSCTFGSGEYWIHSLIDARHVVINGGDGERYAIVDLPEIRYRWFRLPTDELEAGTLFAVAPDLRSLIWWRVSTEGAQGREAILSDAAGRHVLGKLPELLDGRCGSPFDSSQAAFSRSGRAFYILDQLMANLNALLAGRGTETELVVAPPEGGWPEGTHPSMAVWSPTSETLYYGLGGDVMRWIPGAAPEIFLADTPWSHPTFTPDGRYLAYATEDGVYLVDMTAGTSPQLIAEGGTTPVFLNATQLWFKDVSISGCVTNDTPERIYDLNDRTDAPSVIDQVLAVWPATSSQSR